jgi:hypothetical protein
MKTTLYTIALLGGGTLLVLTACQPLQGPPVDLATIATPDPLPEPVRPAYVTPASTPGTFRAWIPRQVTPEGDVTEGHWLALTLAPPVLEGLEPEKPMPRAPKGQPVKLPTGKGQTPALVAPGPELPARALPPGPPPELRALPGGH